MANFTQNISNAVRCFGNGPSSKWGQDNGPTYTMVWGTTSWGEGFAVVTRADWTARLVNSIVPTFDYYGASVLRRIDNTMAVSSEPGSETLRDGSGNWSYVFVSDTTNAEERDSATWSSGSAGAVSYTCLPAGSTTWS